MRVLEVFADVWCPFTHVGLRRLIEERSRLGRADPAIRVRAWPLELINGKALDADLVGEEIQALRVTVAPGLFAGFDAERFPSTSLPALRLAASAYRRSDRVGEQVSVALRTALFEEGRDIADPAVLASIAGVAHLGLPDDDVEQAVVADWKEGQARGVVGSPHFFVDGRGFFCPTLAISRVGDHFRITSDADSFAAFSRTVFEGPDDTDGRVSGGPCHR